MNVAARSFPHIVPRPGAGRRYGILSTYPPTLCGLATFSAALARGLEVNGATVGIVRIADGELSTDLRVVTELDNGRPASAANAALVLNEYDAVVVQHEYGVYGGQDGEEIFDILAGLTVPTIVVAHTVLLEPTHHQRAVLEAIADLAGALVVMSDTARERLCGLYGVDASKVVTIVHGAAVPPARGRVDRGGRPTLLTWGLLGPGKGVEWAIDAVADLKDLWPRPRYVVAGSTHPKVLASEGEDYRNMLIRRTWERGVAASVTFDATYRDVASLTQVVQDASVIVLPYDSQDQVTSGVLVDAIAAGRPVVATAFPHAVELLSSGAGIVVPHQDGIALGAALRRVLTEPGLVEAMGAEAARLAPTFAWPAVAAEYAELAERVLVSV
jgi:glycosyltransferase involved in cell wall biosynthesis